MGQPAPAADVGSAQLRLDVNGYIRDKSSPNDVASVVRDAEKLALTPAPTPATQAECVQSARDLLSAFITKRMGNAGLAEQAKTKALTMLLEQLEASGAEHNPNKLLYIIEQLNNMTFRDLELASGGKQPAAGATAGPVNIFNTVAAPAATSAPGIRTPFKMIDDLLQAASAVIDANPTRVDDESDSAAA